MITLTFPDGAQRQVEHGVSARDVAASISKSLEKKAVAAVVNGTLVDLADPITADAALRIVTRDDPEALELIRHDCAQVKVFALESVVDAHPDHIEMCGRGEVMRAGAFRLAQVDIEIYHAARQIIGEPKN
jgi:threonyl-tRNA synthetase